MKSALSEDTFRLYACPSCSLLALEASPTGKTYSSHLAMKEYETHLKPFRKRQHAEILALLDTRGKGRSLLDVGCATGWFLSSAHEAGYTVTGIEPQRDLARKAQKEAPYATILVQTVEKAAKQKKRYDVISLLSVFEHLRHPEAELDILFTLLRPSGTLILQTPNSHWLGSLGSLFLYRISAGRISFPLETLLQLPYASKHWFLYSGWGLTKLLQRHGFSVRTIYYAPINDTKNLDLWFKSRHQSVFPGFQYVSRAVLTAYFSISRFLGGGDEMFVIAQRQEKRV